MKISIFWETTPYSPVQVNRLFGGKYCFHLQYRIINQERNHHKAGVANFVFIIINSLIGSLSSVVIFMKNAYLWELIENFIFYIFNVGYYDCFMSTGNEVPSK
jgi:hypothetical protein